MNVFVPLRIAALSMIASVASGQPPDGPTVPRVREALAPAVMPQAYGGGDVMLEVAVDASGSVSSIERLRSTDPFTEVLEAAVARWRFEPGTLLKNGQRHRSDGRVLVVGLFRPPALYAGPAPGAPSSVSGRPSDRLPAVVSTTMPAYPPAARGDAFVLVEITVSRRAEPMEYRILGPPSGFDRAALEAVRGWRFAPPRTPTADQIYVYAVLGFRTPVVIKKEAPPGTTS